MTKSRVTFTFNITGSEFDVEFMSECERLNSFIEDMNSDTTKAVVLEVVRSGSKVVPVPQQGILLINLYEQMSKVIRIVQKILLSQHLWIMRAQQDLLGFAADLALACDHIVFNSSKWRFGFPEISAGSFPCYGGLLDICSRGLWLRKDLENRPVIAAKEAAKKFRWVHLISPVASWDDPLVWEKLNLSKSTSLTRKRIKYLTPAMLDDDLYRRLDVLHPSQNLEIPQNQPWRVVWNALRHRMHTREPELFAAYVLFQVARYYLSRAFARWQSRYTLTARISRPVTPPDRAPVYIDLTYLAPPADPIARLIDQQFPVVFFAIDLLRLKEGLNLIFSRFERKVGKAQAIDYWADNVSWFVAENAPSGQNYVLRWFPDDQVSVSIRDQELNFLRFNSNRINSSAGCVEVAVSDMNEISMLADEPLKLTRILAEGVLFCRRVSGLSLSCFVRSYVLQELIKLAQKVNGGLLRLLPALKESGWGFLAEDNAWEYFLRAREDVYRIPVKDVQVGQLKISEEYWLIGIFKEAREKARLFDTDLPYFTARVERHLALLAGLIASTLHEHGLVKDALTADLMVAEVLGFPHHLGTPLHYLAEAGPEALRYYREVLLVE